MKYRKTLVTVFVNAIYLYDDKITIIFNSGDKPVTVEGELIDGIEIANEGLIAGQLDSQQGHGFAYC